MRSTLLRTARRMPALTALIALIALAACQPGANSPMPSDGAGRTTGGALVVWDRNPESIVFRADIVGGEQDDFERLGDIPYCTIYGDNRVVWLNFLGSYETQVLYDYATDDAISRFAELMTVTQRFYTYRALANVQLPSSESPVYEEIQLNVNGINHMADSFSGWNSDYFFEVVDLCKSVSTAPILFEPTGAWMNVHQVDSALDTAILSWDTAAIGIDLAEVALSGAPHWITGDLLRALWYTARTAPPNIVYTDSTGADARLFRISLQVPTITRTSPPPPES